jgi:mannose-6-phosphate isomerase
MERRLELTPILLKAATKDYIWGGTRLRDEFGKKGFTQRIAESWELSCHPDGECIAISGKHNGMKLSQFLEKYPEAMGKYKDVKKDFPVLVKLIDADKDLSVQVHPDDDYAHSHEKDNGKTEMWYVLEAGENSELVYGLKDSISKEELRKAAEDGSIMDKLNRVPVKKGDVFLIKPGTLHAIGKGILIAEIQQSSNVTYRVYDYGRKGDDGKPRQLHIDKALDVADLSPSEKYTLPAPAVDSEQLRIQKLADCPFFRVFLTEMHDNEGELSFSDNSGSFSHILVTEGSGRMVCGNEAHDLTKGSSVFVPAGSEPFSIKGKCSMVITTV